MTLLTGTTLARTLLRFIARFVPIGYTTGSIPDGPLNKGRLSMPVDLQPRIVARRVHPLLMCAMCLATLNRLTLAAEAPDHETPHWVWLGPDAKNGQSLYFRTTFTVAGPVSSARITATCDNHMQVYLNGLPLLRGDDWQKPVYADVADRIHAGRNVIAVWAGNDGGPAGLLLKLQWKPPHAPARSIVTDDRWRVSETAGDGWTSAGFDDSRWASAADLGALGRVAIWKSVDDAALSAATRGEAGAFATPAEEIQTLAGFKTELIYSVPRWQGSWVSLTFDDRGRIITSDQFGRLYRVTPPPIGQSGNQARVEAIDLEIGEAHGLLYAFDSLYVVVSGSRLESGLYRVRDSNGDDQLDQVELLMPLEGAGEHGPHAIIPAPDGKSLYLVAGNHTKLPLHIAGSRVPRVWAEDVLLERYWDPGGQADPTDQTSAGRR